MDKVKIQLKEIISINTDLTLEIDHLKRNGIIKRNNIKYVKHII